MNKFFYHASRFLFLFLMILEWLNNNISSTDWFVIFGVIVVSNGIDLILEKLEELKG